MLEEKNVVVVVYAKQARRGQVGGERFPGMIQFQGSSGSAVGSKKPMDAEMAVKQIDIQDCKIRS